MRDKTVAALVTLSLVGTLAVSGGAVADEGTTVECENHVHDIPHFPATFLHKHCDVDPNPHCHNHEHQPVEWMIWLHCHFEP